MIAVPVRVRLVEGHHAVAVVVGLVAPGGSIAVGVDAVAPFGRLGVDARGAWVDDRDLRVKLWGAARAREMGRNALHKLIYDTRQMLLDAGIDGWFVEKRRGQTRVRLDASRIHITLLP
ncbi:MAG: hypothetical protein QGH45_05420 [Myxococcota bacterium]|nr:hypothetical protein [Myxococcota bacterium]